VCDAESVAGFQDGERRWLERLGNLRNVIRQEMIARQLDGYALEGASVLDVGCGQGTQALRLARRGCRITGLDPSVQLLDRFASDASKAGVAVELIEGKVEQISQLLDGRLFDLVCAHGVLMYLKDRGAAIAGLARHVAADGRLSVTFRNGHALAWRPGLRQDWAAALDAFDRLDYVNELGVSARADRLEDVQTDLAAVGLEIVEWFGVRVFNDALPPDIEPPTGDDLSKLLDAEYEAGRRDPYRWMASQMHVIAAPGQT
jgi:S-adenosylmethionine-dependent methyltransferase